MDGAQPALYHSTLQSPDAFAEWAGVNASWPLADLVRRCLSFRVEERPTAAQLRDELLAAAPRCMPIPEATRAVVEVRNGWLLHDSRAARATYLPPFATPLRGLERVPARVADEPQRTGSAASEAAPEPVTSAVERFLASPERVLVLLGDGGVGKSLTLQQLTAQLSAQSAAQGGAVRRWLPLLLRSALPQWRHADLQGAVLRALQWYGCPAPSAGGELEGGARLLIVCDGYDELAARDGSGGPTEDLPRTLGMPASAKLVLTARRGGVPEAELERRFGASLRVRYFLPFTADQMRELMRRRGVGAEQVERALSLSTVVENPFVLQMFSECWSDIQALAQQHWRAGTVQRRHVYEAALRRWIRDAVQRGGLLPVVAERLIDPADAQDRSRTIGDKLERSFLRAAQRVGHHMFKAAALTVRGAELPDLQQEAWLRVHQLTEETTRGQKQALVAFRLRELQGFLAGCPLRLRLRAVSERGAAEAGGQHSGNAAEAGFAHKSFRDFLAAAHWAADPADPFHAPLTLDPAVQRFAAEFIDPTATTALTQRVKTLADLDRAPALHDAGYAAVRVLLSAGSRNPGAAANALTALNTAGVSLAGMRLAGLAAGGVPPAPGVPFADLGGATLSGADLTKADLRGCRLQQACLDGAVLCGADLSGTLLGELPSLAVGGEVLCVSTSEDGQRVYTCSAQKFADGATTAVLSIWDAKAASVSGSARACCGLCTGA
jgi:hypothetical protein